MRTLLDSFSKGEIVCYNQNKPLFVFLDASKNGLGFVLAHDIHQKEIVLLGSRVLSSAESNYSNIEREALDVIEAVKYFHKFIAGENSLFVQIIDLYNLFSTIVLFLIAFRLVYNVGPSHSVLMIMKYIMSVEKPCTQRIHCQEFRRVIVNHLFLLSIY